MRRSRQPVKAGDDEHIIWVKGAQHFFQLRAAAIKPSQFLLEYLVTALGLKGLYLCFKVLSCHGNARIADQHGFAPVLMR
nr:hypothetical protein [Roseobacter litoralis]